MGETVTPSKRSVEGESGLERDERIGQTVGGPAIEVVAEATGPRCTVEYKRKIVREADAGKTPGAIGTLLRQEALYSPPLTTWRVARERGTDG